MFAGLKLPPIQLIFRGLKNEQAEALAPPHTYAVIKLVNFHNHIKYVDTYSMRL